jgi:glyoxylase-like metal-dependent hydrolase (beta-lactamase superfamily II)
VRELQAGVWHWEAPHPDWKPGEEWDEMVSSYAIDGVDRLLLFDPLAVPSEIEELAADRKTAIVLTCPWHERDARSLMERLGAEVFVPQPDEGDEDVAWLRDDLERVKSEGRVFSAGDRLPVGVEAFPGIVPNDLVLWVESRRAVVAGDALIDRGHGLELPADWLGEGVTPEQVLDGLRPLLGLPVELVLATHGGPADRAALERALS